MGAEFEDVVEGKLRRVGRVNARWLPQPCAEFNFLVAQEDVPAVKCLADECVGEIAETDQAGPVDRISGCRNKGDDSRQNRW